MQEPASFLRAVAAGAPELEWDQKRSGPKWGLLHIPRSVNLIKLQYAKLAVRVGPFDLELTALLIPLLY